MPETSPGMDPFRSATELAASIRRRQLSPLEALDACLERVDQLNPTLNAVIWRNDGDARSEATKLGEDIARGIDPPGRFAGVPMPVKDLTAVEGWPVTYGSYGAPEGNSESSELVVEALRRAGFLLTGRTNTPELGPLPVTENDRYGTTRNPWDAAVSPGGSSGGAAAAVASGMFPAAHGNDGGGSLRIPASCCGLVGLKASRSRVPAVVPGWHGAVSEGVVCRTIADAAGVLDAISGPDPLCWNNAPAPARPFLQEVGADPGRLRVGLLTVPPLGLAVDPEPRAAAERAASLLEGAGHLVEPVDLDLVPAETVPSVMNVVNASYGDFEDLDWSRVEPHNAAGYRAGEETGSVTFSRSLGHLRRHSRDLVAHWGRDFDVLVTPTMAVEPPKAGTVLAESHANPGIPSLTVLSMIVFTAAFNISGLPAVSLPLHWAESGLPVGVQLVAGPWREDLLLRVSAQLEAVSPWADRRPPALP